MATRTRIRSWAAALAVILLLFFTGQALTEIPQSIQTPEKVKTRIGKLEFNDGFPSQETARKVYENLDFMRGVEVFLNTCQGASLAALHKGIRQAGAEDGQVLLFENRIHPNTILLGANPETVTALAWLDLRKGPMVLSSPPNTVGVLNDAWSRHVTDIGDFGPDKGKGGKYVILPPDYKAKPPAGYFTVRARTHGVCLLIQGFPKNGKLKPVVQNFRKKMKIHELAKGGEATKTRFVNGSGKTVNTVHANDIGFYAEVNAIVQEEPPGSLDPELLGLLAAIGIKKGFPFNPDERMQRILEEAVAVGNATARTIIFRPRDSEAWLYPGESTWAKYFIGDSHEFLRNGVRDLDARTLFHYGHNFITPVMAEKTVGKGWQRAVNSLDSEGNYLDGGKKYKLTLPPSVPVKGHWSVVAYDPQTRSMLQTSQAFPGVSSLPAPPMTAKDGSINIYFGPKAPKNKKKNWIKTIPGKGFWLILRLYQPLEPWFDRTWRPGEIELLK
ncbi:MAG: DUF1254 domain-containing protein [Thermodesulfobacteriota bacterium]